MGSLLIGIVDDDDDVLCSSLVDLMRSFGHSAQAFASAETFLASSNLPFDCVIADVHIPGMSGFDLVRRLREQGRTTPVSLITALPDKHLDDEAISAGALGIRRKPFAAATLLDYLAALPATRKGGIPFGISSHIPRRICGMQSPWQRVGVKAA